MQNPAVRSLVATVTGIVTAGVVVGAVEFLGHAIFPPPAGLDLSRPEDQARLMEVVPTAAKLAVVVAWFLGSLAGACVAIAIAHRTLPAWIVGLVIAGLGVWTTQMFPHPAWMVASAFALPLIAVLVARKAMARRLAPL